MRTRVLLLIGCALTGPLLAQDQGLKPAADALGGPTLQVRFERDNRSLLPLPALQLTSPPSASAQTYRLLGDYQFSALRLGEAGGVRVTGGLLINLRSTLASSPAGDATGALPYAGVGYASGSLRGDWGFSADLGLAAYGLGSARLERLMGAGNNGLTVDSPFKLQPMIRLGMNMAF